MSFASAAGSPRTYRPLLALSALLILHSLPIQSAPIPRLEAAKSFELTLEGLGLESGANDRFGFATAVADWNRDGFLDLAVGAPGREYGSSHGDRGQVFVWFGTDGPPLPVSVFDIRMARCSLFARDTVGLEFGYSLETGDWNGDGWVDLAVGAPGTQDTGRPDVGAVVVLYGSPDGLGQGSRYPKCFSASRYYGFERAEGARLGEAIASGDFNEDLIDDLAMGAPGAPVFSERGGDVHVLLGSRSEPLDPLGIRLHQDADGVAGVAESGDRFGAALASVDFDGDGIRNFLAVGVPGEDLAVAGSASGAVHIFQGAGLWGHYGFSDLIHRDVSGLYGADGAAGFGTSLTAGHFGCSRKESLAIGAPLDSWRDAPFSGSVTLLNFGDSHRVDLARSNYLGEGIAPLGGSPEVGDVLGGALASARLSASSCETLAIGVPGEEIPDEIPNQGSLLIVSGRPTIPIGSSLNSAQAYSRRDLGLPEDGALEIGGSVTTGEWPGGLTRFVALGLPSRDVNTRTSAGSVLILPARNLVASGFESGTLTDW